MKHTLEPVNASLNTVMKAFCFNPDFVSSSSSKRLMESSDHGLISSTDSLSMQLFNTETGQA